MSIGPQRTVIDHIPMLWYEPIQAQSKDLIIWLPGFSGTKEDVASQLTTFAEAGFYALSFDPYQHGERSVETREELIERILSNIRRHFWPILALTAEEFPKVIDQAVEMLDITGKVMVGGISMGGDIAVAASGVDSRISAVTACVATPDWLRLGSHEPSGQADTYAQQCYDRRNPLTHLDNYRHRPAISFQCGELDTQVPPSGAERFVTELSNGIYQKSSERLEVCKHHLIAHSFTAEMLENAIKWFQHHSRL
jgi:dienelactone hydrolase